MGVLSSSYGALTPFSTLHRAPVSFPHLTPTPPPLRLKIRVSVSPSSGGVREEGKEAVGQLDELH